MRLRNLGPTAVRFVLLRTGISIRQRPLIEKSNWRPVVPGRQDGYASMNWPCKKLEESVLGGKIAHGGHPVLRWMAGNVSIEKDAADNWKPSKKKSIERIDGIVALIMALDRASTQPPPERSVYETRGLLYV